MENSFNPLESKNPLNDIFNQKDMNIQQKIVEELLSESNLDRKTELQKPIKWSCLMVIQKYLTDKKLPISALILEKFVGTSFKYLISHDRKGRLEYIEALKSLNSFNPMQNQTNIQKLMER